MTTVGRSRPKSHEPHAFTDLRTLVIVLIAGGLSFGAGITVAIAVTATVGIALGVIAGISAAGAAAVVLIQTLDQLIAKDG